MIPAYYEFQNPTKIVSGTGAIEHIGFELASLGVSRPLVITNRELLDLKVATVVLDALADTEATVASIFDDVPADSSVATVHEVASIYRESCADAIVAVGGGSVIDTAKGASVVLTHDTGDLMEHRGAESIQRRRSVPFLVVPTTAGSGSEVTSVAVIKDTDRKIKIAFQSLTLMPDVAIIDPRMTRTMPPSLTASTAMDAFAHAIEAVSSRQANPVSDCFARAALDLIFEYLPRALDHPEDETARLALANASMLAGSGFSNAMVGIVHALGHAAGAVAGIAHGDALMLLLPHGMAYNLPVAAERYASVLGNLVGPEAAAATPPAERGQAAVDAVRALLGSLHERVGLPRTLSEAGVTELQLSEIAHAALNDGTLVMNLRQPTYEDLLAILQGAL